MNRGNLAVFGVAVFFAMLFGGLTFETVMAAPAEKQLVCHVDPDGDGAGLETISIKNNKAVEKHLEHGDHLGACFECGDGFTDPPTETCDDGANNGFPGFCNDTCDGFVPADDCGDGQVTGLETCDDGNDNGFPGFCNDTCDGFVPADDCGDGQVTGLETCDDGNDNGLPGFCNDTCDGIVPEFLPDRVIACLCDLPDDEILTELDESFCVDDTTQQAENLFAFCSNICDLGPLEAGFVSIPDDPTCDGFIPVPVCGDGQITGIETCDDGNDNGLPGFCNTTCDGIVPSGVCGDGQVTGLETCDDGGLNGIPGFCNSTCDGLVPQASEGFALVCVCDAFPIIINACYETFESCNSNSVPVCSFLCEEDGDFLIEAFCDDQIECNAPD